MATMQWRPEVNALTTPQSYKVLGTADMAARMAKALPNYTEEEFRAFIDLHNQLTAESLLNGKARFHPAAPSLLGCRTQLRLDGPTPALGPQLQAHR